MSAERDDSVPVEDWLAPPSKSAHSSEYIEDMDALMEEVEKNQLLLAKYGKVIYGLIMIIRGMRVKAMDAGLPEPSSTEELLSGLPTTRSKTDQEKQGIDKLLGRDSE